jgi:hypothetical protein
MEARDIEWGTSIQMGSRPAAGVVENACNRQHEEERFVDSGQEFSTPKFVSVYKSNTRLGEHELKRSSEATAGSHSLLAPCLRGLGKISHPIKCFCIL